MFGKSLSPLLMTPCSKLHVPHISLTWLHTKKGFLESLWFNRGICTQQGLPWWKNLSANTCQCRRHRFDSWVRKITRRRKWQPTPVFLSGKTQGVRIQTGYSPCGHRVGYNLATKQQQKICTVSSISTSTCHISSK